MDDARAVADYARVVAPFDGVVVHRTERLDLQARASAASPRLGRLVYLQPNVKLVPADLAVAPITLIDPSRTLDDLLAAALET